MDASLNLDDVAAFGDSIVVWEANGSGQKQPFIAQQALKYSPRSTANMADIRKNTGNVGPSDTFPTAYVTTSVMWWGNEHAADPNRVNSVRLQDATGKTPACQDSQIITYPPGADLLVGAGMKLLSKDANYDPEKNRDTFGVFVYATSDPLVFRALFCFSGGNMGSGKNVTGIYPNYSNMDDMTFVSTDGSVVKKEGSDQGLLPNPMNVYDMVTGTDYLTTLRLFLYVKFCADVGCDYSVVAFKVSIFGQLNFDFQFRWLNRGYLENQGYSMAGSIQSVVVRFRL